jgi:hypothetical protein
MIDGNLGLTFHIKIMRVFYFLLICLLMSACAKDIGENPESSDNFQLLYSKGSGWVGSSYELKIDPFGSTSVCEKLNLLRMTERNVNFTLSPLELDSLKKDVDKLNGLKLQNYGFGQDKPTDLPTTFLKFTCGSYSDSCSIYLPDEDELPNELKLLLVRLDRIRLKYDAK